MLEERGTIPHGEEGTNRASSVGEPYPALARDPDANLLDINNYKVLCVIIKTTW